MDSEAQRKARLKTLFESRAIEFGRCFSSGDFACDKPAIRAHSVQNSRVLDLLSDGGHVVAPVLRIHSDRGPEVQLERVGRNGATTFAGLCAEHDAQIFAPIERAPIQLSSAEHRFLLAYRATFYEMHATTAVGVQIQSAYQKRIASGLEKPNKHSPLGVFAVERMHVSWLVYRYKLEFDDAYLAHRFDALEHDLLIWDVEAPTLACSALFSLGNREGGKDILGVCITVMPVSHTQTAVLLSYLRQDAARARLELDRVLKASSSHQKYEVSRLLLNHCQNFVLAPPYVESWKSPKRSAIIDYFIGTIFERDFSVDDEHFMLFR